MHAHIPFVILEMEGQVHCTVGYNVHTVCSGCITAHVPNKPSSQTCQEHTLANTQAHSFTYANELQYWHSVNGLLMRPRQCSFTRPLGCHFVYRKKQIIVFDGM